MNDSHQSNWQTVTETGFWLQLFRGYHELHRGKEPEAFRDYDGIRAALHDLLEFTGMTIERLAARIGMNVSSLRMIVANGGLLHGHQCEKCRKIALDFHYPTLAEFFQIEGMNNFRKQRQKKPQGMNDIGVSNAW